MLTYTYKTHKIHEPEGKLLIYEEEITSSGLKAFTLSDQFIIVPYKSFADNQSTIKSEYGIIAEGI